VVSCCSPRRTPIDEQDPCPRRRQRSHRASGCAAFQAVPSGCCSCGSS